MVNLVEKVKEKAFQWKQQFFKATIIAVGRVVLKDDLCALKDVEFAGRKMFNEKMGDQLIKDIDGDVKYIECSFKSRCGFIVKSSAMK